MIPNNKILDPLRNYEKNLFTMVQCSPVVNFRNLMDDKRFGKLIGLESYSNQKL